MPEQNFQAQTMKHPSSQIESFVFNLGKANDLRCNSSSQTVCGKCDGCVLQIKITPVKAWFNRAGDQTKRRFVLGLLRRLHSVDLVKYVINLLQPLMCKDFMYARSRSKPSLPTDSATLSNDRALNVIELEKSIANTWDWFQSASYWIKSNFLVTILQECEQHLLFLIVNQAKTLLTSEEAAFIPIDNYESESLHSTVHSYNSDANSDLELLLDACDEYSVPQKNPFESEHGSNEPLSDAENFAGRPKCFDDEIINDDSGDELFGEDAMFGTVDPTTVVVPGSSKGYLGVSRYKDFIRCLPVHISKYILGMLDQVSLFNCVCVSKNWRGIVEEVHQEYYINQHLQEEVMLMQGASAHGSNPVYAKDIDVAVPNIEMDTWQAIRSGEDHIQTMFKSEVSFETAYSGFETRKIIMEERNVYCGAYNVMVLLDLADAQRVMHTDGGRLIAIGSHDRKVRLIDNGTCREVKPCITGHAGSVRSLALCEERGFVVSGSFDTSIRLWSLKTGKCQKIFRGHRETVSCLQVHDNYIISGAKDKMCKVWNMETKKCVRTFKHRHAITAVVMGDEMCISGCEAGKVKVWHLETGKLIKHLKGHHGAITAIKFDRWHIITASKDGYALAWSSQGNHSRCLTALRHPKEVLCLEFMFLRVITGSADGKLRIWNMVTGQCLRIMRGNSRSDPILALTAIGNRVTINTSRNLLTFNFEPIDYDYSLMHDKMPPLVQYSKYSDAPVRQQSYSYVRANRMLKAGATNSKIVYHNGQEPPQVFYNNRPRADQLPHSAKTLSRQSLYAARRIQSATTRQELDLLASKPPSGLTRKDHSASERETLDFDVKSMIAHSVRTVSAKSKPALSFQRRASAATKSRMTGARSGTASVMSVSGFQIGGGGARDDDDSSMPMSEEEEQRRRVSWAFEQPKLPQASHMGLTETKTLLRSQIRAHGEPVPPDFVYLSVNAIHSSMKPTEASKNMELNRRQQELADMKRLGRPNSSPSRVDPRTKVPVEDLGWDEFCLEHGIALKEPDVKSVAESRLSYSTKASLRSKKTAVDEAEFEPPTTQIITEFAPVPVEVKPAMSLYDDKIKTSIPKARLIRPHTAKVIRDAKRLSMLQDNRPKSAQVTAAATFLPSRPTTASRPGSRPSTFALRRPSTAQTQISQVSSASTHLQRDQKKTQHCTSSSPEPSLVPMLMYPADVRARMADLRQARLDRMSQMMMQPNDDGDVIGNVSEYNDPLRTHVNFKLHTHSETRDQVRCLQAGFSESTSGKEREKFEKEQKAAWLLKVKGQLDKDYMKKPRAFAPEIRESKDPLAVM